MIFVLLFKTALLDRPRTSPVWTLAPCAGGDGCLVRSRPRAYSFRFADGSFLAFRPSGSHSHGIALDGSGDGLRRLFSSLPSQRAAICKAAIAALAWIAVPCCPTTLTYSTQIPSRQTYLASAALAALFGLAMQHLWGAGESRAEAGYGLASAAMIHTTSTVVDHKRAIS